MGPRERWIVSRVRGSIIVDIGFAGQKEKLPEYFAYLQNNQCENRIIGIDHNCEAVLARRQEDSIVGDARCLPLRADSVDCVILGEFLEHHSDIHGFLAECHRVLKLGGQMLITTPNPYFVNRLLKKWFFQIGPNVIRESNIRTSMGHEDHAVFWDPLSLCNLLSSMEFTVNEITTLGVWIPWLGRILPKFRKGSYVDLWPLNRMGHITCVCCTKQGI
jgi:SAM-dependent methyltransferase